MSRIIRIAAVTLLGLAVGTGLWLAPWATAGICVLVGLAMIAVVLCSASEDGDAAAAGVIRGPLIGEIDAPGGTVSHLAAPAGEATAEYATGGGVDYILVVGPHASGNLRSSDVVAAGESSGPRGAADVTPETVARHLRTIERVGLTREAQDLRAHLGAVAGRKTTHGA